MSGEMKPQPLPSPLAAELAPDSLTEGSSPPFSPPPVSLTPVSLSEVGGVVAYRDPVTGRSVLCSWIGEARRLWVRLDIERIPPMSLIRQHIVEAYVPDAGQSCPPGLLVATCFVVPVLASSSGTTENPEK